MRRLLAAGAMAALAACAPREAPAVDAPADSAAADTLRGRLELVGSEPGTSLALFTSETEAVMLEGAPRPLMDRASGLEITVWGRRTGARGFQVSRFAVRASSGQPVEDGILERDGAGYLLRTTDGRRLRVGRLPESLAGMVGRRVWMGTPVEGTPSVSGVIDP